MVLPLLGVILLVWGNVAFDRLLITKVRADLAVAQRLLRARARRGRRQRRRGGRLARAAPARWHAAGAATWCRCCSASRRARAWTSSTCARADGTLLATDCGTAGAGRQRRARAAARRRPTPRRAQRSRCCRPTSMRRSAPALLPRVAVPLVPTRNAAPTDARAGRPRDGACWPRAPVRDADGALLGHVQAGVLLNRNLPFIDHINDIVYPEGSLPFGSRGTATLFLDDVRISTNVRLFGADAGQPRHRHARLADACATRCSARGSTWLDRAFVVNDWYVSGYQPLADGAGQRVGMLYVGFLERPFTLLKYGVLAAIGADLLRRDGRRGAGLAALARAASSARSSDGADHAARRGRRAATRASAPVRSRDEIGQLAGHLDHLLDVIADKTARAAALERRARRQGGRAHARPARPRSSSWCAARSWPPSASSPPASRTRSTTRSR